MFFIHMQRREINDCGVEEMYKLYHGHNFRGYNSYIILNSLCTCGSSIKSTSNSLFHSPIFDDKRHYLLSTLKTLIARYESQPTFI